MARIQTTKRELQKEKENYAAAATSRRTF